jgi:hypothetical protein
MNNPTITYILAYMFKDIKGNLQDRYITYETLAEAQEAYDNQSRSTGSIRQSNH